MGFSHTLWITYPNGSPYGYFHDAMKSDGVAKHTELLLVEELSYRLQ